MRNACGEAAGVASRGALESRASRESGFLRSSEAPGAWNMRSGSEVFRFRGGMNFLAKSMATSRPGRDKWRRPYILVYISRLPWAASRVVRRAEKCQMRGGDGPLGEVMEERVGSDGYRCSGDGRLL